jgi:hypothetical protein
MMRSLSELPIHPHIFDQCMALLDRLNPTIEELTSAVEQEAAVGAASCRKRNALIS